MKNLFLILFIILILLPLKSEATLVLLENASEKVVYDDLNDQYWFWDLNYFDNYSYLEQKDIISNLNNSDYFDLINWHMASYSEMIQLWTNGADAITSSFNPNYMAYDFSMYRGRYDEENKWWLPGGHMVAVASSYDSGANSLNPLQTNYSETGDGSHSVIGAWVVATEFKSVPEPNSIIYFLVGISGFVLFKKFKF